MQNEKLDSLLRAHAAAWWRSTDEDDFVQQVNATYDAYMDAGGNDAHYDANWRRFSDEARDALRTRIREETRDGA